MVEAENYPQKNIAAQPLSLVYPFDWQGLETFDYRRDGQGVPMVAMGQKRGLVYHPITIAQYGLFNLQKFALHGNENYKKEVQICVRWLRENIQPWNNEINGWVFDFDLKFYGPEAPWISGMAQAQGISLLLRSQTLWPDDGILKMTRRAFQAFLQPVSQGGVVTHFPDGSLIFEEFPTDPPSLVLNGHIFALLGIHDYAQFWQEKAADELFQVAVAGLKKNIERYDTGYWNWYDLYPLRRRLASPMYLQVHVRLLRILADLTGDVFFRDLARKWHNYLRNPASRIRWLLGKIAEKIRLK
ncbi:MAG: D-glucuronyl C5-epimerase family protein [bacterium]